MSKSQTRAKLKLVKSPKKKKIGAPIVLTPQEQETETIEQLATVEFWKNEINSLRSEKFKSVEQAIDKLIDQVLQRLNVRGEEDVREFLRLVFETSEVLQNTLKKVLKLN